MLRGISLDIRSGEFLAIVGPSGCGKTTLLNQIAGLVPVTTGSIGVLGRPPKVGNSQVSYMFARDALLPWISTKANAEFGASIRGMQTAARQARAADLLARVGLSGFEDAYPNRLSQGMRQRVALARTFCLDSAVLLMDEPFGALDAQTKLQLEDLLLQLWAATESTVVFVTHDLSEAIALADRVVVMSSRPGTIKAVVDVPLARPRSISLLQSDERYHRLYSEVWSNMEIGLSTAARSEAG